MKRKGHPSRNEATSTAPAGDNHPALSNRLIALVLPSLLTLSCSPTGTSLLLILSTGHTPGIEQIHLTGTIDEALVFGPAVRPEKPNGALSLRETVRILLPDELAGRTVRVQVDGLLAGAAVARADAEVVPERRREVRVELALSALPRACEGCEGCCDDGRCLSGSLGACGSGGVGCFACDPTRADRCTPEGRCACGAGPPCAPETGADRCVDGSCRCGEGNACPPGTRCDNGVCRCTPDACAGCCSGNECLPGTTSAACGTEGAACQLCGMGERCLMGACVTN